MSKLKKMLAYKGLSKEKQNLIKALEGAFEGRVDTGPIKKTGFSPSALFYSEGRCSRRWDIVFDGVDETYSEKGYFNLRTMENGTDAHGRMQTRLKAKFGDKVDVEVEGFSESPKMHYFIDLVFNMADGTRVPGEIKTAGQRAYDVRLEQMLGADYQEAQLLMYMRELGVDFGLLVYENRDNFEPLIIPVEMTKERSDRLDRLYAWMREIEKAREAGYTIAEFPGRRVNSKICQTCQVRKACDERPNGDYVIELQEKYQL